jgi:hypothetical protein
VSGPARRLVGRLRRPPRARGADAAAPGFGRPDTRWVLAQPDPPQPEPLDRFRLFAVLCTWMEEDIVAATVANALAQGCERVYLLDNASPDGTVAAALGAGAELARTFTTERFEEQVRFDLMHEVVDEVSDAEGDDHVWWLWVDADELPRGARDRTIHQQLAGLDRRFRVVGGRVFNHYPDPARPPTRGAADPLAEQPLCEEARWPFCDLEHHKHPLLRWDRTGPPIRAGLGFHQASCATRPLLEPTEAVLVHHVPFRAEADARRRLDALLGAGGGRARRDDDATDHMRARHASLDAVYAGDWPHVANHMTGRLGVHPRPWSERAAEAGEAP